MNHPMFNTIMVTGFTVAFFHAAIPTHWLPFVLTARIQKWSQSKTLLITALAGLGHVTFTAILGFLVAWCGITLNAKIGAAFPWIAGGALMLFGSYYVFRQLRGKGHGHTHLFGGDDHGSPKTAVGLRGGVLVNTGHSSLELTVFETGVPPQFRLFFYDEQNKPSASPPACEHVKIEIVRPDDTRQVFSFQRKADFLVSTTDIPEPHEFQAIVTLSHGDHAHTYEVPFTEHDHRHHDHGEGHCDHEKMPVPKSDWAAIVSLLALLTFSPCEGFLPVYVSGVQYGWSGFFLLTFVLSLATVIGMVIFTALTLAGMERFKLSFMEKYESGILGGLLVLLGLIIILFET